MYKNLDCIGTTQLVLLTAYFDPVDRYNRIVKAMTVCTTNEKKTPNFYHENTININTYPIRVREFC